MNFLKVGQPLSKQLVYIALFVEICFCAIFLVTVKFLSVDQRDFRQVFFIGVAISLSLIFTGELLNRFRGGVNEGKIMNLYRLIRVPSLLVWLSTASATLFFVELLNVCSFSLNAPIAERDLVSRVFTLLVLVVGARIVFAERSSRLQLSALVISLVPAWLVFSLTAGDNETFNQPRWVVITIAMAFFLAVKRIAGRKCKEKLSQADAMRWSGYITLPLFVLVDLLEGWPLLSTVGEFIALAIVFMITPFITISRQLVFDGKIAPAMHDTLLYLGGLSIFFIVGRFLYPEDGALPFWGILITLVLSAMSAYLLVLDEKNKRRLIG